MHPRLLAAGRCWHRHLQRSAEPVPANYQQSVATFPNRVLPAQPPSQALAKVPLSLQGTTANQRVPLPGGSPTPSPGQSLKSPGKRETLILPIHRNLCVSLPPCCALTTLFSPAPLHHHPLHPRVLNQCSVQAHPSHSPFYELSLWVLKLLVAYLRAASSPPL